MKHVYKLVVSVSLILLFNTLLFGVEQNKDNLTASQLIEKAHKHDNMWASDQDADQQIALEYYDAALHKEPDDEQRLHILYRMAQLYGSAYQLEKGEKPDFHKAIKLYKEIVKSYPTTEPLVFKALISLGDHHITLREFDKGLTYFKKVLEYDIDELEQLRSDTEDKDKIQQLDNNIKRIKQFQRVAVDQVGYCGTFINPLCAHGAFRNISETHNQAFIREYAAGKVASSMAEYSDLWAPTFDMGDESLSSNVSVEQTVEPEKLVKVEAKNDINRHISLSKTPKGRARASPYKSKFLYCFIGIVLIVPVLTLAGKLKKMYYIK